MKGRGRCLNGSTDGCSTDAIRVSSNGRAVERHYKSTDSWCEQWLAPAGTTIDELIWEDHGSVTALLSNGSKVSNVANLV